MTYETFESFRISLELVAAARKLRIETPTLIPLAIAGGESAVALRLALGFCARVESAKISSKDRREAYDILEDLVLSLLDVESDPHLDHAALSTARGRPGRNQ